MSSTDFKKRFDELIEIGETLTSEKIAANPGIRPNLKKWETQCQIALEKAFGSKSIFLTDFQKVTKDFILNYHADYGLPIMDAAREELDLGEKSGKLDEIDKEIKEAKAEAKRRAAVAETKQWGSVIELIDMLREELKRRSQVDQDISEIRKEIGEVSKRRIFGCAKCGNPYEAYPPDDLHDTVALQEPSKKNAESVIKIVHDCLICNHPIILYWYRRKPAFAFG